MSRSPSPRCHSPALGEAFLLASTSASQRAVHPDSLEWLTASDGCADAGHLSMCSASSSSSTSPGPSYAAEVERLQMEADRLCASWLRALSMEHGEERKRSGSDASERSDARKRKRRGGGRRGHQRERKQRRGQGSDRHRSHSGREEEKEADDDDATASDSSSSDSGDEDSADPQSDGSADSSRAAPAVEAEKGRRSKLPLKSVYRLRAFFTAHVQHPYPSEEEKRTLAGETGLTVKQITNWMTNTRRRFLRPFLAKLQRAERRQHEEGPGAETAAEAQDELQ